MNLDAESLRQQIPYYLTEPDQKALVAELKALSAGKSPNYFLSSYYDRYKDEMLQGDGWRGFELFLFSSGERRAVHSVVLSNSCDIASDNKRDMPARVTFSPLVKLSAFRSLLEKGGINNEKIDAKIKSIKAQKTSNVFYLPAGGPLEEDYVVRFDDVHSMPTAAIKNQKKSFTLTMTGFYLLVLKLSVHFCRLQENVKRKISIDPNK